MLITYTVYKNMLWQFAKKKHLNKYHAEIQI